MFVLASALEFPRLFSDRWVLSMTAIDGSRNLPYQAVSTSVRLASRPTLNNYHLRQGLPHTPHHTTPCQTPRDHANQIASATAGASHEEEAACATTSEGTQAASGATGHEVHDQTAAADETADATAHAHRSDETSARGTAGAQTEGEATAGLPKALAAALARARHHPAPHDHLLGSSRPIRSKMRSPRMW